MQEFEGCHLKRWLKRSECCFKIAGVLTTCRIGANFFVIVFSTFPDLLQCSLFDRLEPWFAVRSQRTPECLILTWVLWIYDGIVFASWSCWLSRTDKLHRDSLPLFPPTVPLLSQSNAWIVAKVDRIVKLHADRFLSPKRIPGSGIPVLARPIRTSSARDLPWPALYNGENRQLSCFPGKFDFRAQCKRQEYRPTRASGHSSERKRRQWRQRKG